MPPVMLLHYAVSAMSLAVSGLTIAESRGGPSVAVIQFGIMSGAAAGGYFYDSFGGQVNYVLGSGMQPDRIQAARNCAIPKLRRPSSVISSTY